MAITRYGPDIDDSRDQWRRGPDIPSVRHWTASKYAPVAPVPAVGFARGPFSTEPFGVASPEGFGLAVFGTYTFGAVPTPA